MCIYRYGYLGDTQLYVKPSRTGVTGLATTSSRQISGGRADFVILRAI